MSAIDERPLPEGLVPVGPVRQLGLAALQTWRELPRVLLSGLILLATGVPLVAAVWSGQPWLVALALLPLMLALTATARVGAVIASSGRVSGRDLVSADPVLAALLTVGAVAAAALVPSSGVWQVTGFVLAALWLVVTPMALAYGAVRTRTGLSALRGGAILTAYRPSVALGLLSVGILGAFAIVATAGVLLLVVPALLAAFGAHAVGTQLSAIDANGGAR